MKRSERIGLLARSDTAALIALATETLDFGDEAGIELSVIHPPEVGSITMTVREPVESTRFHLSDIVVTRAEIEYRDVRAASMLIGDEAEAALAAAILDAELEAQGPMATSIENLLVETQLGEIAAAEAEWEELKPTIVSFEEVL